MQNTRNKEVAGVVVLYHPDDTVVNNINSYVHQVDILYVVDNSDITDARLIEQLTAFPNVVYINNGGNKGIAFALNNGVEAARLKGYKWLLTMDQDTSLQDSAVELLYKFATTSLHSKVGIVSPKHFIGNGNVNGNEFEEVKFTMTSGNLLNLASVREIGGFMESLFIDHVDHEFCFRLGRGGYKIFESNTISIVHNLGEKITKTFLGNTIEIKGHSPFRLFYITRNGLVVSKMYEEQKEFAKHVRKTILLELMKSILFYDNKIRCIREIWRGYITHKDYLKGLIPKTE